MPAKKASKSKKAVKKAAAPHGRGGGRGDRRPGRSKAGIATSAPPKPTGGRASLIEVGYDEATGEWASSGPAGRALMALHAGAWLAAAAGYARVSRTTLHNWMARGREHDEGGPELRDEVPREHRPYVDFLYAVDRAYAECEVELVTLIRKECRNDARLAMQFLGRRFSHWRESSQVSVTTEEAPVQDSLAKMLAADPTLARKAAEFEEALAEAGFAPED